MAVTCEMASRTKHSSISAGRSASSQSAIARSWSWSWPCGRACQQTLCAWASRMVLAALGRGDLQVLEQLAGQRVLDDLIEGRHAPWPGRTRPCCQLGSSPPMASRQAFDARSHQALPTRGLLKMLLDARLELPLLLAAPGLGLAQRSSLPLRCARVAQPVHGAIASALWTSIARVRARCRSCDSLPRPFCALASSRCRFCKVCKFCRRQTV